MSTVDPAAYAVPVYFVFLAVEIAVLRGKTEVRSRKVVGYEKRDTLASLGMGIGSLLFSGAIQLATYTVSDLLWPHRLLDLGEGVAVWVLAALIWDFCFYWHHRISHEMRVFWASHVNHHSSKHYNFSTALRQEWTPFTNLLFYPPWVLLGIRPHIMAIVGGANLVFQFFLHTEVVGKLPRPIEWLFNTPSHHRVHHASNERYLDKNYGGILIVWDRLFGTFAPEEEPVVYGLVKNVESFNLWTIAWHEYGAIVREMKQRRGLGQKLRVLKQMPPAPLP